MTRHFCFECVNETEFKEVELKEDIEIKGEMFSNTHHYLECENCGVQIENPANMDRNLESDYNLYRKAKNWLTPAEIKSVREQYGLSQRNFATLLGMSHATLSRYEGGALQTDLHNTLFIMANDPNAFYMAMLTNKIKISEDIYEKTKNKIINLMNERDGFVYKHVEENSKKVAMIANQSELVFDYVNNLKVANNRNEAVVLEKKANARLKSNDKNSLAATFANLFKGGGIHGNNI
ncbi:type II toxin-antitoxin system MqsA family antitoxin [Listeria innocua]|uniref:type II TA system antitoxin MqsA family protein n=1 Tax=Listeria innocua TaxID=1642 RepID=UPI0012EFD457|nr:type II TA system antitoxin MqsA family protein [Listeria innocua]EKY4027642.1 type II toxin-antitoxin system MqsA family antitoxin [Listeria innocua]ELD8333087.1 type II toxin-antitoxin system MqsA family antitoxin [Listeria innocua]ELY0464180.1 type II toxin-antitoxin system MqsA family antitoxin [Listeria innocua]ELY0467059.1 type II toxin-antitoxin system MqsA family antitoxin [Listeria innocua]ELY0470011.1 type II toxin-antitoxin system MqsA family antitoxin [Listeria innocua]